MPFCKVCGARCNDSYKFCNNCGTPIVADEPPPPTPPRGSYVPPMSDSDIRPGDSVVDYGGMQVIHHNGPRKTGLVCAYCLKDIYNESYAIMALGKRFHKDCFKCNRCNQRLFSFAKFYQDDNGMPLCAKCNAQDVPQCAECGKPCTGRYIIAAGKAFHQGCCVCAGCHQPFGPEGFYEDCGKLWHLNCGPHAI